MTTSTPTVVDANLDIKESDVSRKWMNVPVVHVKMVEDVEMPQVPSSVLVPMVTLEKDVRQVILHYNQ